MATTTPKTKFIELLNLVDNVPNFDDGNYYRLLLPEDDRPHGFMLPSTVSKMPWSDDFEVNHDKRTVQLNDASNGHDTTNACNDAFRRTIRQAIDMKIFPPSISRPFRNVQDFWSKQGYTCIAICVVLVRHCFSRTVFHTIQVDTYPNLLDTTVAWGIKTWHYPYKGVFYHDEYEEASWPLKLIKWYGFYEGKITYVTENKERGTIHPYILDVFDIQLPEDMIPEADLQDVAEFKLMSIEEVTEAMFGGKFKPSCMLVIIDFFRRHGIITAETEDDFDEIVSRLRRSIPIPTTLSCVFVPTERKRGNWRFDEDTEMSEE